MTTIRFGSDFELDTDAYELRRAGRVVRLERIPMQVLLLLVSARPSLVTREQIAEKVWGPGVFVDTDNSINIAIRKIRRALREDPERPRYIRTVTGMGYRFVAEVAAEEPAVPQAADPVPAPQAAPDTSGTTAGDAATAPVSKAGWRWAVILAPVALLAFAALYLQGVRPSSALGPSKERLLLAVLPFENLTGDPAQEYFADGLTEEMIARLGSAASERFGVIARTSSMHYKQSRAPLEAIGRELGVHYVLEGSVRRDAERVRITAQLIQVSDLSHLWAHQYDRRQTDILTVQEEVAQAIAERIRVTLGEDHASAARRGPLSPRDYTAYDLYLQGRYFWNKRTQGDFELSIEAFRRSIELNPLNAQAHAGLADALALMGTYSFAPREEVVPRVRAAALEAIRLDPGIAAPHTSLALMSEFFDWDWQGAEESFRRAIELDGNYATAHQWYAEYLAHQGRFEEALEEIEVARRLDPVSLIMWADRAAILYYARRYPEAIEQFRAVIELQPLFARSGMIVLPYVQERRFNEALAQIEEWRTVAADEAWVEGLVAYVYGRLGRGEEARTALRKMEEWHRRRNRPATGILEDRTRAYCGMGLKEEVLAALREACTTRASFLVTLRVDPIYDFVREDPRFQDALRCANLAR